MAFKQIPVAGRFKAVIWNPWAGRCSTLRAEINDVYAYDMCGRVLVAAIVTVIRTRAHETVDAEDSVVCMDQESREALADACARAREPQA